MYVAEQMGNKVRRIGSDGNVSEFAGTGEFGTSGDGGPAIRAQVAKPGSVFYSRRTHTLYIGHLGRIRAVGSDSVIRTVAGGGTSNNDGVLATSAVISGSDLPLYVDQNETIYFTEPFRSRVRKFTVGGAITTVAGVDNSSGFNGDGIPATTARLDQPAGIAADATGNLYIVDTGNYRLRKVDSATGLISTVCLTGAHPGTRGTGPDGVLPLQARSYTPRSIALDLSGNFYLGDDTAAQLFRFRLSPRESKTGTVKRKARFGIPKKK